ncbi:helix-turn-helix transcriptional regulator [Winogradskya humida]|uniref:DNA-binding protein n=1 Tax=Winogradskya humida TaxID=113566 RepID=A0ABQ4A419_9ACTN|nr:helix-turn-helix transcriptional regulator [Actinoplanes humidus]GIE25102.1 DNA-binding protein [Actinoplanes humidus]
MDRARLAEFLRSRREALQPEDVGLPRGQRRRTGGLRREEVAVLSDMSIDYYNRLEQKRGPHPSEQMLAALARGLRLSLEERDHLFQLGGYAVPQRGRRADHVNPGMMRIMDGLDGAAAQVVSHVGETLRQTRLAVALLGDDSVQHAAYTRDGSGSQAAELAEALLARSPEFAGLWRGHPVSGPYCAPKRLLHPQVGLLELHCQMLVDPDQSQSLVVYTATPGSESYDRLELLSVVGAATSR